MRNKVKITIETKIEKVAKWHYLKFMLERRNSCKGQIKELRKFWKQLQKK